MALQGVPLKVDVPGLVAIFGDSLYQDSGSVARELTQNAHDAIIELCATSLDVEDAARKHSVRILFNAN